MEDTQVISWEVEEEEETDRSSGSMGCNLEAVGRLHMFSSAHGPEKDFLLYVGENVIGRMPNCSVALPFPSISKQHAVIDIVAWNKAPILRDCGSLNGTQILRPPKILSPGVTHRLRDQELILFADLPCQYHRLDVCLPSASRGPLTIEETPRAQGGTHSQGLLLAEDSEEEADSVSESCTVKKLRTSSPLATVVPESDEEGPSSAVDVPGAHFAFELDSDTDEEGQRPAVGKAAAARRGFPVEAKQPGTDGIVTKLQLEKNRPLVKERDHDIRTERDAGREVVPVGVILKRSHPADEDSDTDVDEDSRPLGKPPDSHLERGQPSNFMDSDTDVEEEGIPATPAVGPLKRPIVSGVGMRGPGVPALTQLQKSQAVIDADMEQGEAQLAVSLERSQGSVVINSDTDDEDEVSAALTLAHLKESRAVIEHRDAGIKVGRAQPEFLLEQSKSSAESDNDTDVEEEKQTVIKRHTDNDGALVIAHSGRSRSLVSDSEKDAGGKRGSPGVHLERNRASPPMDRNTKLKEEVPLEPAVTHLEKYQPPMEGTSREAEGKPVKLSVRHLDKTWSPPDEGPEIDEEDTSFMASALADVRSQLPAGGDAGTQWAAAVPKRESAVEAGTQGGSPVAQVEQDHLPLSRENLTDVVVNTGTSGDLSQPHKEGSQTLTERETKPHAERTKESKDSHDDSEDLDLQATQCFVTPEENASLEAIKSMGEEPTLFTLSPEPGPSCYSFQTPGTLDESWEVLATQPFCPRESETQHEADGTCPSPPRGTPQDQHLESPVQTGSQAEGKGPSTQNETTGRVSPKREALMREAEDLPPGGEREDGMGEEELTRGLQEREHRQVCADHPQIRESDTEVESADAEEGERRVRAEMETSKEMQAEEIEEEEAPARETLKREAERPVPEGDSEPTGLEVMVPKGTLEKAGTQRGETEGGNQDQKGQASFPTPESSVGVGPLQGLASASVASGSQSGRGRVAPVSPRRQQRGPLSCKMPPGEKASRGDAESPDAPLPPPVPTAAFHNSLIPQHPEHPAPPASSLSFPGTPIPKARQKGIPKALETPLSSEMEPIHPKSKVRSRGSSRVASSPGSSTALEPQHLNPSDQPVTPKSTSWATQGRTHRSSVRTLEPAESVAPDHQHSTSKDELVTSKPTSRATRGRTRRSSVKIHESGESTASEGHTSTSIDLPVTTKPTSRITRSRTQRSSVKTPRPVESTVSEGPPSTSTKQPVTPTQAAQGRTRRSSVKTSEPIEPTASEVQPSTSTNQSVTPEPKSLVTLGRTRRSSVKAPESPVSTDPVPSIFTQQPTSRTTRTTRTTPVKTSEPIEFTTPNAKPSTPTHQPVASDHRLLTTQGRKGRLSMKASEPVENIDLELQPTTSAEQPSTSKDQSATRKPTPRATRSRTHRSSVRASSEPLVPISPDLELSPPDHTTTPELTIQTTQGRTPRSSVKIPEPVEPIIPDFKPPIPIDQHATPELLPQCGRSKTLKSPTVSAVPVPVTPEPILQASCSRRQRAKHEPLMVPIVHEPSSTHPEPKSQSSKSQRRGGVRVTESLRAESESSCPQLLEAPPQSPKIENIKVEEEKSDFTSDPQSKPSPSHKRSEATIKSPPPQKRPKRGQVPQNTESFKEEDTAEMPEKKENVENPGPGKRKRDQMEEEPKAAQSRNLRRSKPNQESTAPKVLFTGVVDARGERAVLALGGSMAASVTEASHLVTDRIRRTVKFLCALGRGIPILTLDWLHQSRKAGCFLPPDEYVVTDPEQEKNFGFSLQDALSRAQKQRLLEGYEIHVTPGVQPPPPQMGEIISCCGGTVLPNMPRSYKPRRVVITCSQDFPRCSIPLRVGLPLVSSEFLLTGVLKQEANPEAFILSTLEMSSP